MTGGAGLAGFAGSHPIKWSTFRFPKPAHFSVPVDTSRRSGSRLLCQRKIRFEMRVQAGNERPLPAGSTTAEIPEADRGSNLALRGGLYLAANDRYLDPA